MQAYLIKYTNDCPHEDLRNQYYTGKKVEKTAYTRMYFTFDDARKALRYVPLGQYSKIIEVDIKPIHEFLPSEHFFLKDKQIREQGLYRPKDNPYDPS